MVLPGDSTLRAARHDRRRARLSLQHPRHRRPVRAAACRDPRAVARPDVLHDRCPNDLQRPDRRHHRAWRCPRPPTWPRSRGPASCRWTAARPRRLRRSACSGGQVMRRIVLPQAMRVIVPPTGNETIAMVKDTSLLMAVPVITELYLPDLADRRADLPHHGGLRRSHDLVPHRLLGAHDRAELCLERYFGRGFGAGSGGPADQPPVRPRRRHGWCVMTRPLPLVRALNVHKAFHGTEVLKGIDLDVRAGRGGLPARPLRLRQDHLPAVHQPAGAHRRRPDLGRRRADGVRRQGRAAARAARQEARRAAPRDRDGVPAVQPVPAHDRAREHHGGARAGARGRQDEGPGAGPGAAGPGRARRPGRRLPGPAVRRTAAAGGDRPGPGDGPQAHALRRADVRARPRARRRRARGHARARRGRA